jgi:hypothetical protein
MNGTRECMPWLAPGPSAPDGPSSRGCAPAIRAASFLLRLYLRLGHIYRRTAQSFVWRLLVNELERSSGRPLPSRRQM